MDDHATLNDDEPFEFDAEEHQQLLQSGCRQMGLALSSDQIAQFEYYYRHLVVWNRRFNLTAITEDEDVQVRHFLDCLAGLPVIAEELNEPLPLTKQWKLVDVGAGAGFPGLPLKIASPNLSLSLIDGTGKKVAFLNHMVEELGLTGATVVQGRAEELGRQSAYRAKYDLVTARAVAPLNTLVEYLLPLACMGGYVAIYKGSNAPQEYMAARKAIDLLGGETVRLAPILVPYLDAERFILLIRKVRRTPESYPRGQGLARKKPL